MHPGFAQWVAWVEKRPETAAERGRLGAHLEDCEACRATVGEIRRVLGAMASDRLLEPSPAVVEAAGRALGGGRTFVRLPAWARAFAGKLARPVFDSFATPHAAFAGARSSSVARRLRYETRGVELDLQIEIAGDDRRLTGQLLVLGDPPSPLADARFAVVAGGAFVADGETDPDGGLALAVRVPGAVELRVAAGGEVVSFLVPEPFPDTPDDD